MGRVHHFMQRIARLMALLGGAVLIALVVMVCLSILGREANGFLNGDLAQGLAPRLSAALLAAGIGPVTGDFELVEAGMAFAVFAFLPICQIDGAHASVDVFTRALRPGADRLLAAVIAVIFAAVLVLVAWQLGLGMASKRATGQITFLLQYPIWWAYAASLAGAGVAALVALWLALVRVIEAAAGRAILPPGPEAGA